MLWQGTLLFAAIDAVFVPILAWLIGSTMFRRSKVALVITTIVFWYVLWTWVLANFWNTVYSYIFPEWAHWLIPLTYGGLFGGISLLFWWLAVRLHGNSVVTFYLMGGLWGMITHLLAVFLGIVDKPPVLQGVALAAAIIVAFFEFIFYWCIILSIAVLVNKFWHRLRKASI